MTVKVKITDTTPPGLSTTPPTVGAEGNPVTVTLDENLDLSNTPGTDAFTVKVDGSVAALTDVDVRNAGSTGLVALTVSPSIVQGQAVTVSYTDPTSGDDADALQDEIGNDVATYENVAVTNNSAVTGTPGAPTELTATAGLPSPPDGTTQIGLAWATPAEMGHTDIDGYRIEWSADGNAPWTDLVADTGSTATTHTDAGLGSETTRHYRVSARNSFGPGDPSITAHTTTADIAPPAPATGDVATDGASVSLTFDEALRRVPHAVAFTVTADGVGIDFGTAQWSAGAPREFSLGGATTTIRQGQTVVVTYTDPTSNTVSAVEDAAGNRAASFTTGADGVPAVTNSSTVAPTAPGKVPSLAAVPTDNTGIALTWDAPADNGGRAIASYRIEVSEDGGTTFLSTPLVETHNAMKNGEIVRRYEHTGLQPGTTRHYRVRAKNAVNDGAWSDTASTATTTGAPGAPTGLEATAGLPATPDGTTLIRLAWTEPSDRGDSAITGYKVEWSADGSTGWTELEDDTGTAAETYTDAGLGSETTRHYRVRAINGVGPGSPSIVAHTTTADIVAPVLVSAGVVVAGNKLLLNFNERLFPLGQTNLLRAITVTADGVRVSVGDRSFLSEAIELESVSPVIRQGQTVVVTYMDLNSRSDDATGVIQDDDGNDAASFTTGADGVPAVDNGSTVQPAAPGKVPNVAAEHTGETGIALTWGTPGDNGGRVVTSYRIEWSADGNAPWTELVAAHTEMRAGEIERRYEHTGLDPDTTRHYRVRAKNAIGDGDWSDTASTTTTASGSPGAPAGLTATPGLPATPDGTTEIDLAWNTPTNIGGSDITGYRIERSADGDAPWTELEADTGTVATTYTDTGLGSETTRHYRVRAINDEGTGPPSDAEHATTADIVRPVLVVALFVRDDKTLNLTFNEPLDGAVANLPPVSAFTVTADGAEIVFGEVFAETRFRREVYLSAPQPAIRQGQTVVVAYEDPTSGNDPRAIQDTSGNDAASFTTGAGGVPAVINESTEAPTAPGKVPNLAAAPGSDTSIVLTWDRPDNGGRVIASYRIEVSEDVDPRVWQEREDEHDTMKDGAIERRYEHAPLDPATTRHYRVRAKNAIGDGEYSDPDGATTTTGAPDAPTGLTATPGLPSPRDGTTLIRLGWDAPTDAQEGDSGHHGLPDRGLRGRRPAGLGGAGGRHREPEPGLPAHRAWLGGDPPLPGLRDQRRRHEPGLGGPQRQNPRHFGAGAGLGERGRDGDHAHDRLQRDARRDGGEPAGGRAFHGPGR